MPITFPAHAAAVLPIARRMSGTALVVGSAIPDFAFVVRGAGVASHSLPALVWFCVPVGFAVYGVLELSVLPALRDASGVLRTVFASRGFARDWRALGLVIVSLVVGAITHLAWDSVTHSDRWPGSALFDEQGAAWAHLGSSIVGSLVVVAWFVVRVRKASRMARVSRSLWAGLLLAAVFGVGSAWAALRMSSGLARLVSPGWAMFFAAFVCVAIASRLRRRGG